MTENKTIKIDDVRQYAIDNKIIKETKVSFTIKDNKIFNPDDLKLTKKDILIWITYKRKKSTIKFMQGFYLFVAGTLRAVPEKQLVNFWNDLIFDFNDLIVRNSLAHAQGNKESFGDTYKKIMDSKQSELKDMLS